MNQFYRKQIQEQAKELNETIKVRIGPSKISGVGVFALRDIKKDERCFCIPTKQGLDKAGGLKFYSLSWKDLDRLYPEVKQLIVDQWPSIIAGSHFLSPNYTTWPILFMNHSEKDVNFNQYTDLATKDIPAGTELLENYKLMDRWKEVFPWLE